MNDRFVLSVNRTTSKGGKAGDDSWMTWLSPVNAVERTSDWKYAVCDLLGRHAQFGVDQVPSLLKIGVFYVPIIRCFAMLRTQHPT